MLYFFRKKLKVFGFLLFGIIIIAFVFMVPGGMNDQGGNTTLAKVGDAKIPLIDFWTIYQNAEQTWRDRTNESIKDDQREQLKIDVLAGLIHEAAILQVAEQEGITVTNKEIEDAIKNEKAFWRDGAFNPQFFDNVLRQNNMDRKFYINARRRELIKNKVLSLADNIAVLTPAEEKTIESMESENIELIKRQLLDSKRDALRLSYAEGLKSDFLVTYKLDLIKGK